jgi:hypothetical protein
MHGAAGVEVDGPLPNRDPMTAPSEKMRLPIGAAQDEKVTSAAS